jgi:exosortase/archaeosortase family protein
MAGPSVRLDGLVIDARGVRQPITASCFGLLVIAGYLAALTGTPASWPARWRGTWSGVPLLVGANALRLIVLGAALAVWPAGFLLVHVLFLGVAAPIAVLAVWGWWLRGEAGIRPAIPWRFAGRVALALVPAALAWWLLLRAYLLAVLATGAAVVSVAGVSVERVEVVQEGLARYLSLTVPAGTARIEATARSLGLVSFLALAAASPVRWTRRLALGLIGVAACIAVHGLEVATLILLGLGAPGLVAPAEAISTFLTLAAGPMLWVLLFAPSHGWWGGPGAQGPAPRLASPRA